MQTVFKESSTKCSFDVMVFVIAISLFGLFWSLRLALADFLEQRADAKSLELAIAFAPGNENYLRRAAEIADETGTGGSVYYSRALSVDPYAAQDWLRLGFDAERDGRYQEAERDLLQATRVNRLFEPRWALANFYFRRGDTVNAFYWARQSLIIGGGDLTAAFRLCWAISASPARIFRDAIPIRPAVLEQYRAFLLKTKPGG